MTKTEPMLGDVVEVTWNNNANPGEPKTIEVWDDQFEANKHCFDSVIVIIRDGKNVKEVVS